MAATQLIRLRAFREADLAAAATLVANLPLWRRYRYTAARCAKELGEALQRGDDLWIAARGQAVVGLAWVLPRAGVGRLRYLKLLAVGKDVQKSGIGARLLAAAERRRPLLLLVSDFNRGARRFYARQGYTRIGAIPELVLPGVTEILMFKGVTANQARPPQPRSPESGAAPKRRARRAR